MLCEELQRVVQSWLLSLAVLIEKRNRDMNKQIKLKAAVNLPNYEWPGSFPL